MTPQQEAEIATYASMHSIVIAVRCFSKELDVDLKESSVRAWKAKYLTEVSPQRQCGEVETQK